MRPSRREGRRRDALSFRLVLLLCLSFLPLWAAVPGSLFADRQMVFLDNEESRLLGLAERSLDQALDAEFGRYRGRLGGFVAWAYGWRTSYQMLRQAAAAALGLGQHADAATVDEALTLWIRRHFVDMVFQPEGAHDPLLDLRRRWLDEIRPRIDAAVVGQMRDAALAAGRAKVVALPEWEHWPEPGAQVGWAQLLDSHYGSIKLRLARPVVTRLTIRPAVAAGVAATSEAMGSAGELVWLGGAGGFAVTLAGFLSIDYLLNRIDAHMSEATLQEELRFLLRDLREQLRERWLADLRLAIRARLRQAQALLAARNSAQAGTSDG